MPWKVGRGGGVGCVLAKAYAPCICDPDSLSLHNCILDFWKQICWGKRPCIKRTRHCYVLHYFINTVFHNILVQSFIYWLSNTIFEIMIVNNSGQQCINCLQLSIYKYSLSEAFIVSPCIMPLGAHGPLLWLRFTSSNFIPVCNW